MQQIPSSASPAGAADFLIGGGEMGERIRAFDWAATPLGPAEGWPQSLRTALGILVDNQYPMYIAWGREYVQFYNDAYRPILGSTKHPAVLGSRCPDTFAEIWDFVQPVYERVMTLGEPTYFEDQLLPLDRHGYAEECYFTYCDSALRDESGVIGGVLVTIIETTERVLGERRLRTLRDLGASSTEAKTPEAACVTAARILGENVLDLPFFVLYLLDEHAPRARRMGLAGLPPDHPAAPAEPSLEDADPAWPLAEVAADGAARVVEGLAERFGVLECGPWPEKPSTALVVPIARPGQERPAGFLVAGISGRRPLDDGYRDFVHAAAERIATAISNARAHEEERRRAEMLAELDRAKTAFFSNVSHEFRTPLTLILGPVEALREEVGPALEPAGRELLETAHRNGLRLQKLVNTLLDFARIEAGRVDVTFEPTDLARLTAELASAFRSAADRAGLLLVIDCPPLSGPVYVDAEMWEKIVLNLVSNALKFTFEGEIAVTLREAGGHVELSVRDTGVGIAADDLPQIFQRFHRVRGARARSHEGSGIGLALVDDLARLHGGSVRAESTVDVGTTITVSIPRGTAHLPPERIGAARALESTGIRVEAYVQEAERWSPDAPPPSADGRPLIEGRLPPDLSDAERGGKILVVDDNADMRGYITRLLAPHYHVQACEDGRAALEAVARDRPDLVLTDVMMPGIDGFQLLRELRGSPRTRTLPVILLSARAGEEATLEGLEAGADDYLTKPFSARELRARVGTQLRMARMRERLAAAEERNRLALELHDTLLQDVIGGSMQLEGLLAMLPPDAEGPREVAARVAARLDRTASEGRKVVQALAMVRHGPRDLPRVLTTAAADLGDGAQADFVIEVEGEARELRPAAEEAAYRVGREALANAFRHAGAARVTLRLEYAADAFRLRVTDDGRGMSAEELERPPEGHLGMVGMRERARAAGAALDVRSAPGHGTEVELTMTADAAYAPEPRGSAVVDTADPVPAHAR